MSGGKSYKGWKPAKQQYKALTPVQGIPKPKPATTTAMEVLTEMPTIVEMLQGPLPPITAMEAMGMLNYRRGQTYARGEPIPPPMSATRLRELIAKMPPIVEPMPIQVTAEQMAELMQLPTFQRAANDLSALGTSVALMVRASETEVTITTVDPTKIWIKPKKR